MALSGLYRTLATQVTGRLKFVSPLCLAASEKVLHTSAVWAAPPDPKPVPLPKLKDRYFSVSENHLSLHLGVFCFYSCGHAEQYSCTTQYRCSHEHRTFSAETCSFLDGTSSTYLEELEERYRADPTSVDKTWASFFNSLGARNLSSLCHAHILPCPMS